MHFRLGIPSSRIARTTSRPAATKPFGSLQLCSPMRGGEAPGAAFAAVSSVLAPIRTPASRSRAAAASALALVTGPELAIADVAILWPSRYSPHELPLDP
eukprot:7391743-Prymnesium_polylepis.1